MRTRSAIGTGTVIIYLFLNCASRDITILIIPSVKRAGTEIKSRTANPHFETKVTDNNRCQYDKHCSDSAQTYDSAKPASRCTGSQRNCYGEHQNQKHKADYNACLSICFPVNYILFPSLVRIRPTYSGAVFPDTFYQIMNSFRFIRIKRKPHHPAVCCPIINEMLFHPVQTFSEAFPGLGDFPVCYKPSISRFRLMINAVFSNKYFYEFCLKNTDKHQNKSKDC